MKTIIFATLTLQLCVHMFYEEPYIKLVIELDNTWFHLCVTSWKNIIKISMYKLLDNTTKSSSQKGRRAGNRIKEKNKPERTIC